MLRRFGIPFYIFLEGHDHQENTYDSLLRLGCLKVWLNTEEHIGLASDTVTATNTSCQLLEEPWGLFLHF